MHKILIVGLALWCRGKAANIGIPYGHWFTSQLQLLIAWENNHWAQMAGSLPPTWKTRMKLLDPGFGLA